MLNVWKIKNSNDTYDINIEASSGVFSFTFAGNLDLYFTYYGKDIYETPEHSFVLEQDNFLLYRSFKRLFDAIENERPFENGLGDSDYVLTRDYLPYPLLTDNIISWHSDDGLYNDAAVLYIEKLDDVFKITIKEGLVNDIHMKTASVRFRNNGSLYHPYNFSFMGLYNELCKYDFNDKQINIFEYMNRDKVRKR